MEASSGINASNVENSRTFSVFGETLDDFSSDYGSGSKLIDEVNSLTAAEEIMNAELSMNPLLALNCVDDKGTVYVLNVDGKLELYSAQKFEI